MFHFFLTTVGGGENALIIALLNRVLAACFERIGFMQFANEIRQMGLCMYFACIAMASLERSKYIHFKLPLRAWVSVIMGVWRD